MHPPVAPKAGPDLTSCRDSRRSVKSEWRRAALGLSPLSCRRRRRLSLLQGTSRRPLRVAASQTNPAGPFGQHTKVLLDETKMPTKW